MKNIATLDPIEDLRRKANQFVSVEEVLTIICSKLDCSRKVAAEIVLSKLPDEYDHDNRPINPLFFGKKLGIATFSYCDNRPLVRDMLLSIIQDDQYAFEKEVLPTDFDDIPF
ncbi:hypothetical protein [Morganella morganii]|uniref:hypothetical protein n=1 Tax=Morganella morganii TaxID=582 RepID=UPI000BFBE01C|nr:hypothetical protein [Morganella morganii]EKU4287540.1 hypothetical protein [Morganella morganii]EKU4302584.1 hypothetical protein [Morganella morganii]EKU5663710.1 hypothetical protein [Morganella morganii]EKU5691054.1 hypothetical protein [Morganella morganii]EKU6425061.1 hypothetical protein [Morganella morganii]